MTIQNQKVQKIAREVGMLYKVEGNSTEYGKWIQRDNLCMSFEYENPEDCAHIQIYEAKSPYRNVELFRDAELDRDLIQKNYPQFFKPENKSVRQICSNGLK